MCFPPIFSIYVCSFPPQPSRHGCLQIALNTDVRHCVQRPGPVVLYANSNCWRHFCTAFTDARAPNPA